MRRVEFMLIEGEDGGLPMLMQRTDPTRSIEEPDESGVVHRVAERVVAMNVDYHDGLAWLGEWEASHGRWPLAVLINLAIADDDQATRVTYVSRLIAFAYGTQQAMQGMERQ